MNGNYALNLNDTIKVKLTDHGKDIFYHRMDDLIERGVKLTPKMPKVDADGYTTFQLWDFIQLYGEYIGMALPNVIEPIDIVIEGKNLRELGEFSVSEVE